MGLRDFIWRVCSGNIGGGGGKGAGEGQHSMMSFRLRAVVMRSCYNISCWTGRVLFPQRLHIKPYIIPI